MFLYRIIIKNIFIKKIYYIYIYLYIYDKIFTAIIKKNNFNKNI